MMGRAAQTLPLVVLGGARRLMAGRALSGKTGTLFGREQIRGALRTLEREQCALDVQAAAEPGERAVSADDPMTGHDDRQRIRAVCESHRAGTTADTETPRELAVGDRLPIWNRSECLPHAQLEAGALGCDGQVEAAARTAEILHELGLHLH